MMREMKAQSAMEYLMTYGWAILIIAVVLGALFSLGVFSGASLIGTSCVASPGFLCSSVAYSHTTGGLSLTIGQNTGKSWLGWAIMYAPASASLSANSVPSVVFMAQTSTTFGNGQVATVNLPVSGGAAVSVGTPASGDVWVCYVTGSGVLSTNDLGGCTSTGTIQYAQIATLTAKAV